MTKFLSKIINKETIMTKTVIVDYEKYDKKPKVKNHLPERHNQTWTFLEDFALTERFFLIQDLHQIAILHKRSFRSICCRLYAIKLVPQEFNKTFIDTNNLRYIFNNKGKY